MGIYWGIRWDDGRLRTALVAFVAAVATALSAGAAQADTTGTSLADVQAAIAAPADGGAGIGVALIDSGTVPVGPLDGRVVTGPDFSADADDPDLAGLDTFGHGTHLAGIIAAVAPSARLINVKVAAADGSTTLGRLQAAINWTIAHRNDDGMNIRVMNLSLGVAPERDYVRDLLAYTAEQAYRAGIVVVVSAGNAGQSRNQLDSPAYDPHLLAVGADDLNGTTDVSDDSVPNWSGHGVRGPDVVAPGKGIVSLRVPGSFLDVNHPGARVSDTEFRGSGTSQAAAAVSGAVADLLSVRPDLTPYQVKQLLMANADALPGTPRTFQGAGRIDVAAAVAGVTPTGADRDRWAELPADRGAQRGRPGVNPAIGSNGAKWNGAKWNGSLWTGSLWNGSLWSGSLWSGSIWSGYYDDPAPAR